MTDDKVTVAEVYRAVLALDTRCVNGFAAVERDSHSLRNKVEATNLKVAVIETQIGAVQEMAREAATVAEAANDAAVLAASANAKTVDPVARWTAFGTGIGSAVSAALSWFTK
jgi:hypothetical protein